MNEKLPLSDERRRLVCRCSFLLFCAVPTFLVLYLILHPFTANNWEQLVEAKLGIKISIDSVERTGPWTSILRGVKVLGETPDQTVAVTEVKIHHGSKLNVEVDQPVSLSSSMAKLILSGTGRKLFRRQPLEQLATIQIRQIRLEDPACNRSCLFRDVHWVLGPAAESEGKISTNCTKLIAKTTFPEDANVRNLDVYYEFQPETQKSWFRLDTMDEMVEGWVLTELFDNAPAFVAGAKFSGEIKTACEHIGRVTTQTTITGYLADLEIQSFAPDRGLSGKSQVSIRQCELENGKISRFQIQANCQSGTMEPKFLDFARHDLRLALASAAQPPRTVGYSNLAFNATFQSGVLSLEPIIGQSVAAHGINAEPLIRWNEQAHQIDLCDLLLNPAFQSSTNPANQTVELLSYFDLPNPLTGRISERHRTAERVELTPTLATPPKTY